MRARNDATIRRRSERAIALPLATLVVILVMVAGVALIEVGRTDFVRSVNELQEQQALAAAEIGVNRAKAMGTSQKLVWWAMRYNGEALSFAIDNNPPYNGHYVSALFTDVAAPNMPDATYSVVIEETTGSLWTSGSYRIHAYGRCGNATCHVTMGALTLTFASFGWLTNSENNVYFQTGDTVDGWVYTNDHLNINGRPVFTGKVNSGGSYINYYNGGPPLDNPDFRKGLTLNSPYLDFASVINQSHIATVRAKALSGGVWYGANSGRP